MGGDDYSEPRARATMMNDDEIYQGEHDIASFDESWSERHSEATASFTADVSSDSRYTDPLWAHSLVDMFDLFRHYIKQQGVGHWQEERQMWQAMADTANKQIVETDVPNRLLRCISAKLQHRGVEGTVWFEPCGQLRLNALAQFIMNYVDQGPTLAHALQRLFNLVTLDKPAQVQLEALVLPCSTMPLPAHFTETPPKLLCLACTSASLLVAHDFTIRRPASSCAAAPALTDPNKTLGIGGELCALPKAPKLRPNSHHMWLITGTQTTPHSCSRGAQELRSADGAGIMCWYAAAHPALYLDDAAAPCDDAPLAPPTALRWYMRGRADLARDGSAARFDAAVIQDGRRYDAAVQELGLRLGALKWLFAACVRPAAAAASPGGGGAARRQRRQQQQQVQLTGRVFMSERFVGRMHELDMAQAARQRDGQPYRWGFCAIVHPC
ncbi:hypothetical protein JKP88DRAFT_246278 [Tribonema minus]|uniref:Uncharacterized protein n=1 Tax=Tribonema minus TaxID=303371 RepID=A0A835YUB2_9STRA|nr:hypothetical protein JKP88DRAFT_246278 [Tribonema minus]